MTTKIKAMLIEAGVRNLKEFGYPSVDKDNILTDYVFSGFFRSMLEDNKGRSPDTDTAINELLSVIATNRDSK